MWMPRINYNKTLTYSIKHSIYIKQDYFESTLGNPYNKHWITLVVTEYALFQGIEGNNPPHI